MCGVFMRVVCLFGVCVVCVCGVYVNCVFVCVLVCGVFV